MDVFITQLSHMNASYVTSKAGIKLFTGRCSTHHTSQPKIRHSVSSSQKLIIEVSDLWGTLELNETSHQHALMYKHTEDS